MDNNARDRIAEHVKNAYAAGYNDGGNLDSSRMDEVAETETERIIAIVREALATLPEDAINDAQDRARMEWAKIEQGRVALTRAELGEYVNAAFGADDDGGER